MVTANPLERIFSVDYKSKIRPVVSVCKCGRGLENLNGAEEVTIDNTTEDIYVADGGNNRVKVLDNNGKILFKFGDERGEGKMDYPTGLAICGDRILISQESDSILNYQVNGKFVSRIGKPGNGELEFHNPHGLAIDESNGEVYICDCYNDRLQILSNELIFKTQFRHYNLKRPLHVQLSKEFIYILDQSYHCVHLLNCNLLLQKSVISLGPGLPYPTRFFYIDISNNFFITDLDSSSLSIFNSQFELIHKISIPHPSGVTVDNQGRVIVACRGSNERLHIY
ncbi:hypothetical protein LOD99_7597 [Oopsacas minuta]|uniref:Uncharacterized protein n=1 Tax=Oopsacas minuta TaxID=111878 RepID=A0AAV7JQD7_9METZ|nr:hypothetical protein LOD99_7597 [Oopsacas minuta]